MCSLTFTNEAWLDYIWWQQQDKKTLKKINELLSACSRFPFEGIGQPEALKGDLSGLWSRHIDKKNRLVYQADDSRVTVISCRNHC
ncbi:toxin YoeB [Duganella sp. CF402]|uniref:Txe/YoeB family addiction module toxin n=1 Tax=unclassified Duganella TaxID=2636909 RepID=UPI0008C25AD2|nr:MULTISPECIES: Txe/YoeB family addiction module toxin [unclassified Duganella]SEN14879.1 toxin YoeB [Duganella sp. CF402]